MWSVGKYKFFFRLGFSGLQAKMKGLESEEYDTELYDRLEQTIKFQPPLSFGIKNENDTLPVALCYLLLILTHKIVVYSYLQ